MVTSRELIDYLFNATNIRTFEARNITKCRLVNVHKAIIYCRQANIKILASQSNTNLDKKQAQNILTIYPH